MTPCTDCSAECCKYFALEIDTPRTKQEFENIRWYLAHKHVAVFVDKRKWFLEINNTCQYLEKGNKCGIYDKRPLVCREHDPATCEYLHDEFGHSHFFSNLENFDKYLKKRFPGSRRKATPK